MTDDEDPDKVDNLERVMNLLCTLRSPGQRPVPLKELLRASRGYPDTETEKGWNAARMLFHRDRRHLRSLGIEIEQIDSADGSPEAVKYFLRPEGFELGELDLTDDERAALGVALATVRLDLTGDPATRLGLTAEDPTPFHMSLRAAGPVELLVDAASGGHPVRFDYRGRARRLHPYRVVFRDGFTYVHGWDVDVDDWRTYRADRIEDGRLDVEEDATFDRRDDFDSARIRLDPLELGDGEPVIVSVLVDADHAPRVIAELDLPAEQHADGLVVKMAVRNQPAFRSWLLGLLGHAEVLDPPEVRQMVIDWLDEIVAAGR